MTASNLSNINGRRTTGFLLALLLIVLTAPSEASPITSDPASGPESQHASPVPPPLKKCFPEAIDTPTPPYPKKFLRERRDGIVYFAAHIQADGAVKEVRALKNSTPELVDHSLSAVKQWKFKALSCAQAEDGVWIKSYFKFSLTD